MSSEDSSWLGRAASKIEAAAVKLEEDNKRLREKLTAEKAQRDLERGIPKPSTDIRGSLRAIFTGLGKVGELLTDTAGIYFNIARGGYSREKKQEAIQRLKDASLLVSDYEVTVAAQVEAVSHGLGQVYGGALRPLVAKFIADLPPLENIVVVPNHKAREATQVIRQSDHERNDEFSIGGCYLPDAGILLIEEPSEDQIPFFKVAISEEWMHAFLSYSSRRNIPFFPGVKDLFNYLDKKCSSPAFSLAVRVGDYYSDPTEQVTKALVLLAIKHASNYNPFLSFSSDGNRELYKKSAALGQKRIDELGIDAVLAGQYDTDHEKDFTVNAIGVDL